MYFLVIYSPLKPQDNPDYSAKLLVGIEAGSEEEAKKIAQDFGDCEHFDFIKEVDKGTFGKLPKTPVPNTYVPFTIGFSGEWKTVYVEPDETETSNPLLMHGIPDIEDVYINNIPYSRLTPEWREIIEETMNEYKTK